MRSFRAAFSLTLEIYQIFFYHFPEKPINSTLLLFIYFIYKNTIHFEQFGLVQPIVADLAITH